MAKEKTEMKDLVYIQTNLKAPKNQRNAFGNYNYRSCEDIMEAVKPLLAERNCSLVISDEITQVADRIYVKATATLHTSTGEVFSNSAFAREPQTKKGMDDSQITGATSSYARKYALNGLFCIDDTKDADATNTQGKDEEKKTTSKTTTKTAPSTPAQPITLETVKGWISQAKSESDLLKCYNACPKELQEQAKPFLTERKNQLNAPKA